MIQEPWMSFTNVAATYLPLYTTVGFLVHYWNRDIMSLESAHFFMKLAS